jgi:hypothetical protein
LRGTATLETKGGEAMNQSDAASFRAAAHSETLLFGAATEMVLPVLQVAKVLWAVRIQRMKTVVCGNHNIK